MLMIHRYLDAALRRAHYASLEGGEGFFGTIEGFPGLWANGQTLESCKAELKSALDGWLSLSNARHLQIPVLDGIDIAASLRKLDAIRQAAQFEFPVADPGQMIAELDQSLQEPKRITRSLSDLPLL